MITTTQAILTVYPTASPLDDFRVEVDETGERVVWLTLTPLTPEEIAAIKATPGIDATVAAQETSALHVDMVAELGSTGAVRPTKLLRAGVLLTMDEINLLRGLIIGVGTLVFDPANMANATGVTSATITVTGAAFGDTVAVAAPYSLVGVTATAYVSAANTVVIRLHNGTGAAVNLASGTWTVVVRRDVAMPQRTKAQLITAMTNTINAGSADT